MPPLTKFPEILVERQGTVIRRVVYRDPDGEELDLTPMHTLSITSDVQAVDVPKTTFTLMARLVDVEV